MRWKVPVVLAVLTLGCSKPATFDQAEAMPSGAARTEAYVYLAEQGDYRAQVRLGAIFRKDDPVKSAKYYKQASDAGDIDAMYFLGVDYLEGAGVPQNQQEGIRILQAGAKAGSVSAMEKLGNIFASSSQKSQNKADGVLAEQYYQSAFLHGSKVSATYLWTMYGTNPMADKYKSAVWSGVTYLFSASPKRDPYSLLAFEQDGRSLISKAKDEAGIWYLRFNSQPKAKTILDLNGMYK